MKTWQVACALLLTVTMNACSKETKLLPDVRGLVLAVAEDRLAAAGFEDTESVDIKEGRGVFMTTNWIVKTQDPLPGKRVELDTIIRLGVERRPVESSPSDSTQATRDSSPSPRAESKSKREYAMGEPAPDGQFTFTVTKFECGAKRVGSNQYLTKEAQGRYCFLHVNVKNHGDRPQTLFADNQYLRDSEDKKYSADQEATFYYSDDNRRVFAEEINPGNDVSGVIVFDVTPSVTPIKAELHDSAFSGGVLIRIG